jgi:YhcH/YjgK/YiaL family protein
MLHAVLDDPGTHAPFLGSNPVWARCLAWLRGLTPETPLGRHPFGIDDLWASVQEYETRPREECRFESHRDHVDIQYTIAGSEIIDWIERGVLEPDGDFADDVQFWSPPGGGFSALAQEPRRFAVFFPADAHRPKVMAGKPGLVRKAVIKIHRRLLG